MTTPATALTPEQVLRLATAHILDGIDQHHLAFIAGVNPGRIAEAVKAIEWAMNNHKLLYKVTIGTATVVPVVTSDES